MKNFCNSLFLFSRDLRINDNTALFQACKESEGVIPCFIFEQKIISQKNPAHSEFRIEFLMESINDLVYQFKKKNSRLHIFLGDSKKIIPELIESYKIDALFTNLDYSPYAKKIKTIRNKISSSQKIPLFSSHDLLLHEVNLIKSAKGTPYVIFSQYYNKAKMFPVMQPQKNNFSNFLSEIHSGEIDLGDLRRSFSFDFKNKHRTKGGRRNALKILNNLSSLKNYKTDRNFPALDFTSYLSAHNKFGTCSIREEYWKIHNQLGPDHELITQLYWRDFFTYVMYHFPYSFSKPFRKKFSKITWNKNKKLFQKWCDGMTGFPIVDAGMRQLNSTGFMHNRVRMIVASFLTKDLHINWKWGERYFAKKLVDYDPCVNVGNWQWAASTGCDSQPWFRIFNPWLQQQKYDSDCEYIKKWIPELKEFTPREIHKWFSFTGKSEYPNPVVVHHEESYHTKEMFRKISL